MKFSYTKNPPHQKSTMGGKKGKGKGEPREENRRGKREGNVDFCASFLFPSLLPRRCSSLVKIYPFVFIKNRKVKFKMLQRSRADNIRPYTDLRYTAIFTAPNS